MADGAGIRSLPFCFAGGCESVPNTFGVHFWAMANPNEIVDAEASKPCPKCKGERYRHNQEVTMPGRIDPRYSTDPSRGFSLTQLIPLTVIICKNCRFVESYYVGG
jgi:predicted nucleic-acid-binding Zn-ribbon protein